jgi:hypothetical protein
MGSIAALAPAVSQSEQPLNEVTVLLNSSGEARRPVTAATASPSLK